MQGGPGGLPGAHQGEGLHRAPVQGKGEGEPLVWDALYTAMCSDILEKQHANPDTNFIISQAVYTRSTTPTTAARRSRDMVRELLGPNLTFLILDMDKELQVGQGD